MKYYLYNPLANNGIKSHIPEGARLTDASKTDYPEFFSGLKDDDEVVLIGGDGTINYLINQIDPASIRNNIYLYSTIIANIACCQQQLSPPLPVLATEETNRCPRINTAITISLNKNDCQTSARQSSLISSVLKVLPPPAAQARSSLSHRRSIPARPDSRTKEDRKPSSPLLRHLLPYLRSGLQGPAHPIQIRPPSDRSHSRRRR